MSAVPAVLAAMKTAVLADAGMIALVADKVFAGKAPRGTKTNYIVVGDVTGEDVPTFTGSNIETGTERIHLWASDMNDLLDVYSNLRRVLHRLRLNVPGYYQVSGTIRLVTAIADPTDAQAQQGVVEYDWTTQVQ